MSTKNNNDINYLGHQEVAESIIQYKPSIGVHYSLESANNKPIDISLMTGNNLTNKKGSEKK